MLNIIFLLGFVFGLGGVVFLVARKIPALAELSIPVREDNLADRKKIFIKAKAKSLFNRLAGYLFKKIILFFHKTENLSQNVLKGATRLYQRQKKEENIQEDILKRKEEISQNSDYWHNIKRGLVRRKKKISNIKP